MTTFKCISINRKNCNVSLIKTKSYSNRSKQNVRNSFNNKKLKVIFCGFRQKKVFFLSIRIGIG